MNQARSGSVGILTALVLAISPCNAFSAERKHNFGISSKQFFETLNYLLPDDIDMSVFSKEEEESDPLLMYRAENGMGFKIRISAFKDTDVVTQIKVEGEYSPSQQTEMKILFKSVYNTINTAAPSPKETKVPNIINSLLPGGDPEELVEGKMRYSIRTYTSSKSISRKVKLKRFKVLINPSDAPTLAQRLDCSNLKTRSESFCKAFGF